MIIIEGMDGSGKTTLAKRLAKDLRLPITHFGPPPKDKKEFSQRCMRSAALFNRPNIQDRTPFISDLIYARLENRDPYITQQNAKLAIGCTLSILIYCRPEKHVFHQTKKYDSPEYLELLRQYWLEIQASYDTLMAQLHAIRYDWTRKPFESLIYSGIIDLAERKIKQIGF